MCFCIENVDYKALHLSKNFLAAIFSAIVNKVAQTMTLIRSADVKNLFLELHSEDQVL